MSLGIDKEWRPAGPEQLAGIPVTTGVYEVRRDDGAVADIGYAGSREPFGLRSAIARVVAEEGGSELWFRFEQHVQYQSRYVELVLHHKSRHDGTVPDRVRDRRPTVPGRISTGN